MHWGKFKQLPRVLTVLAVLGIGLLAASARGDSLEEAALNATLKESLRATDQAAAALPALPGRDACPPRFENLARRSNQVQLSRDYFGGISCKDLAEETRSREDVFRELGATGVFLPTTAWYPLCSPLIARSALQRNPGDREAAAKDFESILMDLDLCAAGSSAMRDGKG